MTSQATAQTQLILHTRNISSKSEENNLVRKCLLRQQKTYLQDTNTWEVKIHCSRKEVFQDNFHCTSWPQTFCRTGKIKYNENVSARRGVSRKTQAEINTLKIRGKGPLRWGEKEIIIINLSKTHLQLRLISWHRKKNALPQHFLSKE